MQRLISDSLVLIATVTEDSTVAYRFLCVIHQAAHARDSLISGASWGLRRGVRTDTNIS